MTSGLLDRAVDHLCRAAVLQGGPSDEQLLRWFVLRRDEAAFSVLVRRHGPMVFGVCRRILNHVQDAEDAFQATFLVLARKADTIDPPGQLANWLYGVAYRVSQKARSSGARRRAKERQAAARVEAQPYFCDRDADIRPVIDQELERLPEKYRSAVVLCDLQGRPRKDAARQLGCPEGTLSSRLATARGLLAARLSRRGLALSVAGVSAVLASSASAATVSAPLAAAAVHTAIGAAGAVSTNVAFLAKGALITMMPSKLISAACVALLAIVGGAMIPSPFLGETSEVKGAVPAAAAQEKKPRGEALRGNVVSVDTGKGTITLAVPGKDKNKKDVTETTIAVDAGAKVILADFLTKTETPPTGKLADLLAGTRIDAELSADGKSIVAIVAHGPGMLGRIKAVDADKRTITVGGKSKDGPTEDTITLLKDAKVLLNDGLSKGTADKEGKLSELAEGTPVLVQLTVNRKSALAVRVQGVGVHGSLKALDEGNNTITITVKEDGNLVDKTYKLAKDAKKDGNLTPGAGVNIRLSVFDKETAVHVQARE